MSPTDSTSTTNCSQPVPSSSTLAASQRSGPGSTPSSAQHPPDAASPPLDSAPARGTKSKPKKKSSLALGPRKKILTGPPLGAHLVEPDKRPLERVTVEGDALPPAKRQRKQSQTSDAGPALGSNIGPSSRPRSSARRALTRSPPPPPAETPAPAPSAPPSPAKGSSRGQGKSRARAPLALNSSHHNIERDRAESKPSPVRPRKTREEREEFVRLKAIERPRALGEQQLARAGERLQRACDPETARELDKRLEKQMKLYKGAYDALAAELIRAQVEEAVFVNVRKAIQHEPERKRALEAAARMATFAG